MPIDDSGTKSVVYAAMVDGEYVPITLGEFVESVLVPTISEKVIPMLQDEVLEFPVKFWKRLPAEIRFPKKHRRQASIDRKRRRQKRKSKKVIISASVIGNGADKEVTKDGNL